LQDEVVVTIIATGFAYSNMVQPTPKSPQKKVTRLEMDAEGNLQKASEQIGESFEEEIDLSELEQARVITFNEVDEEKQRKIEMLYGSEKQEEVEDKGSVFDLESELEPQLFIRNPDGSRIQVDPESLFDEKRLEEIENIPAYKRRNVKINDNTVEVNTEKNKVSRFSISDDGKGSPKISPNNRYLHDNVD